MSTDQLIDALWGEPTPARPVKRLQVAVARLRGVLAGTEAGLSVERRLRTVGGGYRLVVASGELDAAVFEARLEEGRLARAAGEPARAGEVLREALTLWRGPAAADLAYEGFAQGQIRRLEEQRLACLEERIEADLDLGCHGAVIGELEALTATHAARERLVGLLMLAQYRVGSQADALDTFQRTRSHLVSQLGLEPGPSLRALQAEILRQAPSLDPPVHASPRV